MFTEEEKGGAVARAVWIWLKDQESIELVPWVTNPKSDKYDALATREQLGRQECLKELKELILSQTELLRIQEREDAKSH